MTIISPLAMELSRAAPFPIGSPAGRGGCVDDVEERFLLPGVASGFRMEGAGASLVLLPLPTGRVFDLLPVS